MKVSERLIGVTVVAFIGLRTWAVVLMMPRKDLENNVENILKKKDNLSRT